MTAVLTVDTHVNAQNAAWVKNQFTIYNCI